MFKLHTGTLIVVTLLRDLFGMDGTNNVGEDDAMGTFGKGGLKEFDGEFEWHSVQSQSDD